MVTVTPQLLIPLGIFLIIFFIVIFAILKLFSIKNRNWFMLGMFFGGSIYFMLAWGSTFKESFSASESLLKFIAVFFGGTYYVTTLLFSILISLLIFAQKPPKIIRDYFKGKEIRFIYIITGMSLIFSICDVYLALKCIETIPFFENLVSTNSTCS